MGDEINGGSATLPADQITSVLLRCYFGVISAGRRWTDL